MQAITKYKSNDGSEWNTPEQAIKRDEMIHDVELIMAALKPHPEDLNWKGYVQQDIKTIRQVKEGLFAIANQEVVLKWSIDSQKKDHGVTDADFLETHASWFGRMLDGGHRPLERAYGRLCCIDEQDREWNQPYYASHPEQSGLFEYQPKTATN